MKIIPLNLNQESDLISLEKIAQKVWRQYFPSLIGPDQTEYMIDKFQSRSAFEEQNQNGFEYFIIEKDHAIIGYMGLQTQGDILFISKFYLLAEARGQQLGYQMMEFVKNKGERIGLKQLKLTVNKYNDLAVNFYKRFGFYVHEEAVFDIGAGYVMDDFVMVFDLG